LARAFCQSGTWRNQKLSFRIVYNYACAADWVEARCNSDEIAIGGGGTSYGGDLHCPGSTASFKDISNNLSAPMLDGSVPSPDLQGWRVTGGHVVPGIGDNLQVYAVCAKQ
jgi:hypothetical protein